MLRNDETSTLMVWQRSFRLVVASLLLLSALQFLANSIVYRTLGSTEADKLIFAGSLVFAAVAFALCVAFWKSGAPTWKHKVAVAIVALPAVLNVLIH